MPASEPGRLGLAIGAGAEGLADQLDEAGAVDQLDRVLGDELLGGERERPRRDEEALVAARVVDRAEELLQLGRADDGLALAVLALDDPEQPLAADAEVGPLVAGAADDLDFVPQRLEQLADELLEPLGRQRVELRELRVGPPRLVAEPLERAPCPARPARAVRPTSASIAARPAPSSRAR